MLCFLGSGGFYRCWISRFACVKALASRPREERARNDGDGGWDEENREKDDEGEDGVNECVDRAFEECAPLGTSGTECLARCLCQ
jgi:hypothetical protein